MADFETLLSDRDGSAVRITLNRPDAANVINDVMARELSAAAHPAVTVTLC